MKPHILLSILCLWSGVVFAQQTESVTKPEATPAEESKEAITSLGNVFGPFEQWVVQLKPSEETQKKINQLREQVTENTDEGQALEILTSMIVTAEPSIQNKMTNQPEWLTVSLRLQEARQFANDGLYEDAQKALDGLKQESSPFPATFLFYQGLIKYQSLDKEGTESNLKPLLEMKSIPKRYRELSERMLRDIGSLKPKSLAHISRRMGDVAGRLDSGRANQKTVEIEDGIVKDLDEEIQNLEKQLEQMQQQQQQNSPNPNPQAPQKEQAPSRVPGKGKVDNKDVGDGAGWGNLPEKEREKDLQQIQENFPPHYRDIIEQYFKRMSETEN